MSKKLLSTNIFTFYFTLFASCGLGSVVVFIWCLNYYSTQIHYYNAMFPTTCLVTNEYVQSSACTKYSSCYAPNFEVTPLIGFLMLKVLYNLTRDASPWLQTGLISLSQTGDYSTAVAQLEQYELNKTYTCYYIARSGSNEVMWKPMTPPSLELVLIPAALIVFFIMLDVLVGYIRLKITGKWGNFFCVRSTNLPV